MSNDEETPVKATDAPVFQTITEPKELRNVVENDIYLLGGQVAILCQFAHPALAKGSYKHSSFATRIPQRLRNTARFLNAAYHARVKGDDYDANDPELHKWTAATLFFGIILVREAFFGKMSDTEMDVLLKESAIFGTSLRMPPEMWPATLAEFWAYWDHNIATLEVTDMARKLSRDLMYPINLPLSVAASMPLARIITVNWLPERLAQEYDLQPTPASRIAYQAFVASTRIMYPWIPQSIKQRQHDIYMEDLRKAVRRIKQTGHWVGA
ncbi:hypothetical protein N7481_009151 [Penicillium waksmanii]|uniref:uncharacterized protein n=1 Tax=Penicillium waksmanii TaxID=69791 RepID=UPI0025487F3A|nr:uncharacterized protein N7481_009151 [Penicillium waksmanii]KAJ5975444.1 hypothetical protein N7481_009151 [Penicillium waksmanii]